MSTWTTPADVRTRLRRQWDRGSYLRAIAAGEEFTPIDVKITGPRVAEINSRRGEVTDWISQWHQQENAPETTVVYRTKGGRGLVGQQRLPDRVCVATLADLEQFLGTAGQTQQYREMLTRTVDHPVLAEWVASRPMRALEHYSHFETLLSALTWIEANAGSGRRLREIDAAGVDTKFIENHQRILLELGRLVVDGDLIATDQHTLAGRFGFATPERRVRLRRLDEHMPWPMQGFDDVEVRVDDLALAPLGVECVYIVENLATYLSLPSVSRAVAIFGGGYAASTVGAVGWLREVQVRYWGDLDTHGFAILDRVRAALPHAHSMLMDTATLLAHHSKWGIEPSQVTRDLPNLTIDEARCYRELTEDVHGHSIRLEQERIPLSALNNL